LIRAKRNTRTIVMKLTIRPASPFDFDLSARIFLKGDEQIRRYQDGKYWQVVRLNKDLVLLVLAESGTVNAPVLKAELRSNERVFGDYEKTAKRMIQSLFNLDIDLNQFYADVERDRILTSIVQKLRGLRSPATATVFEALISSIIEQQISLDVAQVLEKNVRRNFGDALRVDDKLYYAFPPPQKFMSATIEQLRSCGLSQRKAEYIKDVSKLIIEGKLDLETLKNREDSQRIIEELCKVRGIGVWTAELTMIRGMQKLDVIPADDLGLRRTISHYYNNDREISSKEVREIARNWGKWAGLAGFYLIVAETSGVSLSI